MEEMDEQGVQRSGLNEKHQQRLDGQDGATHSSSSIDVSTRACRVAEGKSKMLFWDAIDEKKP